jgi:diaminohydroxyphosphoribosylaminopyrimidine deaminase/5-amino-6-(5-phosphoribosylamino)uracil reductase
VLAELHRRGRQHLFLEGGPTVAAAFLRAGLVDEVVAYVAPKLLGAGVNVVGDLAVDSIGESLDLTLHDVTRLGDDVRLTLQPRRPVGPVETKETP